VGKRRASIRRWSPIDRAIGTVILVTVVLVVATVWR
jgi:hypothetical protein